MAARSLALSSSRFLLLFPSIHYLASLIHRLFLVIDINECLPLGGANCPLNSVCMDTDGSYVCNCAPGFLSDGSNCNSMKQRGEEKRDRKLREGGDGQQKDEVLIW